MLRLGIDRLLADPSLVSGSRWGLVTNLSAITRDAVPSVLALLAAKAPVTTILGPEHGLKMTAQAGYAEASGVDDLTGLAVIDTYRMPLAGLVEQIRSAKVDALVCDLVDVGARFYTYMSTIIECWHAASQLEIPCYVLDRPNPLGGARREGPGLASGYESFIGKFDVAIRHGLTMGELVREAAHRVGRGRYPLPEVITVSGWARDMTWRDYRLPWAPPSPNLPTEQCAEVYVGMAFLEGTNLSEGRGTTRPFELVGAPWLDEGFAEELNAAGLPGVTFRPTWFIPTFSKWEGESVGGVQIHVLDPDAFQPIHTGVELLRVAKRLSGDRWTWLGGQPSLGQQAGESVRHPTIDLSWGSPVLRELLDTDASVEEILQRSPAARPMETDLLY